MGKDTKDHPRRTEESRIELLTCSAGDYASSQRHKLLKYDMVGLSCSGDYLADVEDKIRGLASKDGCQVVVNTQYIAVTRTETLRSTEGSRGETVYTIAGTGLRCRDIEKPSHRIPIKDI